jgi:hypothetical protein
MRLIAVRYAITGLSQPSHGLVMQQAPHLHRFTCGLKLHRVSCEPTQLSFCQSICVLGLSDSEHQGLESSWHGIT